MADWKRHRWAAAPTGIGPARDRRSGLVRVCLCHAGRPETVANSAMLLARSRRVEPGLCWVAQRCGLGPAVVRRDFCLTFRAKRTRRQAPPAHANPSAPHPRHPLRRYQDTRRAAALRPPDRAAMCCPFRPWPVVAPLDPSVKPALAFAAMFGFCNITTEDALIRRTPEGEAGPPWT